MTTRFANTDDFNFVRDCDKGQDNPVTFVIRSLKVGQKMKLVRSLARWNELGLEQDATMRVEILDDIFPDMLAICVMGVKRIFGDGVPNLGVSDIIDLLDVQAVQEVATAVVMHSLPQEDEIKNSNPPHTPMQEQDDVAGVDTTTQSL